MAIGDYIEHMGARLDAFKTALVASLPDTREVKDSLMHVSEHLPAEVAAGVVMIVSTGEKDYDKGLGRAARGGKQGVILVGHIKVADDATRKKIQDDEIVLIEEIKAFVRSGIAGMDVRLTSSLQSRQMEHPYGWVACYLEVGPPLNTI